MNFEQNTRKNKSLINYWFVPLWLLLFNLEVILTIRKQNIWFKGYIWDDYNHFPKSSFSQEPTLATLSEKHIKMKAAEI